ncbi:glutathione S-transferase family protein [Vibrio ostreicida]|uniref:Glutathione S-transferase N-terminal domain-containing protein n=1 Tax=Vibrio ostreicida TaxID=526588 RepID=A0ABT8BSH1_9VIBR|nr:glutathione S-transferase N-terminal domain-containing protein [Vibrio ostreicida]MDN3609643.1 glutathione S-transferase N-terminal domain-containing protein [Vibrio ostreicida]NPD09526.1 glutathione S-transferase [Vibrio ostreicida]
MQLYLNDTSPFSRVVAATALLSRCAPLSFHWVDPWRSPAALKNINPFCLIPALTLEDGTTLSESLCICQYLIETYQPLGLRQIAFRQAHEVKQLGTAKTLMEIAFRTAALGRYTDCDNVLIQRGQEGMVAALKQLNQDIENDGLEAHIAPNLATLYLHVALDYVVFRHGAVFSEHEHHALVELMRLSPYNHLLSQISIQALANQPDYTQLLTDLVQ